MTPYGQSSTLDAMARILIVDDERDVVTLIKFLLEKDGHEIIEAFNGKQALEILGVDPRDDEKPLPDLMILDVMMPLVDGYTVCRKMADNARAKGVKVFVLTARGQMRDLFEPAKNILAFIEKPFSPNQLRKTVQEALGA